MENLVTRFGSAAQLAFFDIGRNIPVECCPADSQSLTDSETLVLPSLQRNTAIDNFFLSITLGLPLTRPLALAALSPADVRS